MSVTAEFRRVRSDLMERFGGAALGVEALLVYLFLYLPIGVPGVVERQHHQHADGQVQEQVHQRRLDAQRGPAEPLHQARAHPPELGGDAHSMSPPAYRW